MTSHHRFSLFISFVAAFAIISGRSLGESRIWTDSTGKHKVSAELVAVDEGSVVLRTKAGKEINVPLARLSEQDQQFIESQDDDSTQDALAPRAIPATYKELLQVLEELRYATEVVSLINGFVSDDKVSDADKAKAKESLAEWDNLAEDGGIRYGGEWRTNKEVEQLQNEASVLLASAGRLIAVGNIDIAEENLRKARMIDPEGARADFTLGLMNALAMQPADAETARKYFASAINRLEEIGNYRTSVQEANLVAALNNAAICEVRLGSYGSALRRWQSAIETTNPAPEVIQNLGRFSELSARSPYLNITDGVTRAVAQLYGKIAAAFSDRPYDPKTGWLYVMPISDQLEDEEKSEETETEKPELSPKWASDLRLFAFGTGFVVADGVILTNRHVAEDVMAFGFKVNEKELEGVKGITRKLSSDWDLALIDAPGLNLPPLKWVDDEPRIGTELRVLGYPKSSALLGDSLKVTGGAFVGKMNDDHYLYDAVLNQGNSGGPAINKQGAVLAVNTFILNTDMAYSGGVPFDAAREFLDENAIVFASSEVQDAVDDDQEWVDVIEEAGKSTVQILCYTTPGKASWASEKKTDKPSPGEEKRVIPKDWNGLEDLWCMYCDGLAHVECHNRKCKGGIIVGRATEIVRVPGGRNITKTVPTRNKCPTCSGRGRRSCPHCNNGVDPSL